MVVLPQGVAFATLAGMPPEYGLYAAMVPCVVAALFGSSRLMITGPANAISLTTLALIAPLATPGSPPYISLVLTLTFLVGALQLSLGLARAGRLIDFVPHSVIVGFTAGAAILIINSQIGPFLGLDLPRGASVIDNVRAARHSYRTSRRAAPLVGAMTIVAVLAWRPLNRWIPAMLAGVVIGAAAAWLLAQHVPQWPALPTVEALPGALPPFSAPDLSTRHAAHALQRNVGDDAARADRSGCDRARCCCQVWRQAGWQPGVHRTGPGESRRLVLLRVSGKRFVQPLGCQRCVGCAHSVRCDLRGALSDCDSVFCCTAGALSAVRGDRGAAVSGRLGIDRSARDRSHLATKSGANAGRCW